MAGAPRSGPLTASFGPSAYPSLPPADQIGYFLSDTPSQRTNPVVATRRTLRGADVSANEWLKLHATHAMATHESGSLAVPCAGRKNGH